VEFNPLNAELNPICHLLALLGAHHILHINRIKVKEKVIQLITGPTGTISKSLRQYLSNIKGKHRSKELQKKQQYCALRTYCGKC
jgi:hypothetical protein